MNSDSKPQNEASEPKGQEASSYSGPMWTVYCHTHIATGRRYVGLTKKRMLQRWNEHVYNARSKQGKGCRHFWNAIRAYGKDAFSHETLETCRTIEAANEAEERWIAFHDAMNPEKGFNLCPAKHTPHPVRNPWDRPGFREKHPSTIAACHTPEARKKQREALTPEKRSAATKKAMARPEVREAHVARYTEEHCEKISRATSAALSSPEARARLSRASRESATAEVRAARGESIRRAYEDPAVRERHRAAVKEAQARPEVRAKHAARTASKETRAKISASAIGRRHSPEAVARMRESYWARRGLPVPADPSGA